VLQYALKITQNKDQPPSPSHDIHSGTSL